MIWVCWAFFAAGMVFPLTCIFVIAAFARALTPGYYNEDDEVDYG